MKQDSSREQVFLRAKELAMEENYSEAIKLFKLLERAEPNNVDYKLNIAVASFYAGDYDDVIKTLDNYLQIAS